MKKFLTLLTCILILYGFKSYLPYHNLNWIEVEKIDKKKLKTGDIIILNKQLTIYGGFGHSALYIKQNNKMAEYPQIGKGCMFINFEKWINEEAEKDRKAIVLRLKNSSFSSQNEILRGIVDSKDKKYKIVLDKKDDSGYYCSQWIWNIFYKRFALDLDSNKGILTMPYDFIFSPNLEMVNF